MVGRWPLTDHLEVLTRNLRDRIGRAAVDSKNSMPGKRIQFDEETWQAVDLLARDRMMDFQELADEAFRDILKKYDRPTDLRAALRRSAKEAREDREPDTTAAPKGRARKPDRPG